MSVQFEAKTCVLIQKKLCDFNFSLVQIIVEENEFIKAKIVLSVNHKKMNLEFFHFYFKYFSILFEIYLKNNSLNC